jgi:hypothetical protein
LSQLHDDPDGGIQAQAKQFDNVWMIKLLHYSCKHQHLEINQKTTWQAKTYELLQENCQL